MILGRDAVERLLIFVLVVLYSVWCSAVPHAYAASEVQDSCEASTMP
jgi:hypothetical protein